jgi:hypothetical protein
VTGVVPRLNVAPDAISDVIVAQLVVVGGVHVTTFEHSFAARLTVMLDGQPVMMGGVLSVTVTLNVQVDTFPASSVAVYVTGVVPRGNADPEAMLGTRETQVVEVGGTHVTIFEHSLAARLTVIFDGQPVITGAVLSVTITSKVQVDVLPAASVAVYVTGVIPRLKVEPGVMGDAMVAQLIVVGGVHVTVVEHSFAARFTVMFDGQPVITGGSVSVTITLKVHVEIFPAASVAV